ncbi:MAG: EpsI family protein, partial [Verrucomicrobiota bacterium]|nr:EpsI family protein [Verrucomicrobiota bacterium]
YRPAPVADAARDLLRYNDGGGGSWASPNGRHWLLYYFRWLPGRTAALFVKVHRPDVCLPASGLTLQEDAGIRLLEVNGIRMPIHRFRFDAQGQPLHIYYCYWDSRSSYRDLTAAAEEDWTMKGRLRAAWTGRREMGSQMVELVVAGYQDNDDAWNALSEQLKQLVQRTDA